MNRDNQKINEILTNQELKPTDKLILLYLSSNPNTKFSNKGIANKMSLNKSTVKKYIKNLRKSDYIEVGNIMGKGSNGNQFIAKRYVKNINWKNIDKDVYKASN